VVANALAPYAANLIGDKFDTKQGSDPNAALQLLSHALLGALLAEVNGGNGAGGAAAAAGGELAAKLLTEALYPGYTGELDDQQKQTILALSQAVGALAGSSAGEGMAGVAMASGLAKNSVENNYLSHSERMEYLDALLSCAESGTNCDVKNELQALSEARDNALIIACQVPESALCNEQRALALEAQDSHPNSTMANAHAEIGLIQQAFDAGLTRGQNMSIVVRGEEVCSYCRGNLTTAAERSGLNSLQVVDTVRGRVSLWIRRRGWIE
jgi:hypothetical protein